MSRQPAPFRGLAAIVGVLVLGIAACSTAAPGASTSAGTSAVASAAASSAAPSAASSEAIPSVGLPSFNADLNLEAQLPNDFCGQKVTKISFSGSDFLADDAQFAALVTQLGKSPSDVSAAIGSVAGPECTGIILSALRIKGVDQGRLQQLFLDSQTKESGAQPTKMNVGGKDVWVYTDSGGQGQYVYFRGDTGFFVTAASQADAAKGLAVLP